MEKLLALRVPAAIVALLILGLRVVAAIVGTVVYSGDRPAGSVISAAEFSYRTVDPALVVLLVLVVASCILVSPVRPARALARAGALVVGLSVLVALGLAVLGASRGGAGGDGVTLGLATLDTLLLLAVPLLGFVFLVRLLELAPVPGRLDEPEANPAVTTGGLDDQVSADPAPDPALEPTWQPDLAAGAAWHTAGDAAAGAPASGWGTPGQSADWTPRVGAGPDTGATGTNQPDSQPEDDPGHRWGRSAD
jgi:hypothetical protein